MESGVSGFVSPFRQVAAVLFLTGRPPPPLLLEAPSADGLAKARSLGPQASVRPSLSRANSEPLAPSSPTTAWESSGNVAKRTAAAGIGVREIFFSPRKADVFMLGVVLFFIWTEGATWHVSDASQDAQ